MVDAAGILDELYTGTVTEVDDAGILDELYTGTVTEVDAVGILDELYTGTVTEADEAETLDDSDDVTGAEEDSTPLEDDTGTFKDSEDDDGTTLAEETATVTEEEYGVVEGTSEVISELEGTAEEEAGAVVDGAIHFVQTVDVIVLRTVEVERVVTVEVLPADVCVSVTGQVVRVVTTLYKDQLEFPEFICLRKLTSRWSQPLVLFLARLS